VLVILTYYRCCIYWYLLCS